MPKAKPKTKSTMKRRGKSAAATKGRTVKRTRRKQ